MIIRFRRAYKAPQDVHEVHDVHNVHCWPYHWFCKHGVLTSTLSKPLCIVLHYPNAFLREWSKNVYVMLSTSKYWGSSLRHTSQAGCEYPVRIPRAEANS